MHNGGEVLTTRPEGDHEFGIVPRADDYSVAWTCVQRVKKKADVRTAGTFANAVDIMEHGGSLEGAVKDLGVGVALVLKDGVDGILVLLGSPEPEDA